jgi:hypothetical protein
VLEVLAAQDWNAQEFRTCGQQPLRLSELWSEMRDT